MLDAVKVALGVKVAVLLGVKVAVLVGVKVEVKVGVNVGVFVQRVAVAVWFSASWTEAVLARDVKND